MNSETPEPDKRQSPVADDKPAASRRSCETRKPTTSRRSAGSARFGQSVAPYNPGLRELVEGKKAGGEPPVAAAREQGFCGWHQRGRLPHYDVPGVTQFVTFRLADALPASRRSEWEALLKIESERERRMELEAYLDRGAGECWLARPEIAAVAESALRYFDGERYRLQAWVVMPNHVHLLVDIWQTPLAVVMQSWKHFIAREANKLLGREGTFWEREYWDILIRDEELRRKAVRYVEANPVKAHLAAQAQAWPWSSARLRDEYGRLPSCGAGAPSCTRLLS